MNKRILKCDNVLLQLDRVLRHRRHAEAALKQEGWWLWSAGFSLRQLCDRLEKNSPLPRYLPRCRRSSPPAVEPRQLSHGPMAPTLGSKVVRETKKTTMWLLCVPFRSPPARRSCPERRKLAVRITYIYLFTYIYMYIYHIYVCVCVFIYIYTALTQAALQEES